MFDINKNYFKGLKELNITIPIIYDDKQCALMEVINKGYLVCPQAVFYCYYKINDKNAVLMISGDNSNTIGFIRINFTRG